MEDIIKDIGKTIKDKEKVTKYILIKIYTKDNFIKGSSIIKDYTYGIMDKFIKEIFKTGKKMEMEYGKEKMVNYLLVNGNKIK